jgi:predicted nucleotidyltransferase
MTNTLGPTFAIRHDRSDPVLLEAIRAVDAITRTQGVSYLLAGATARELILRHVFGRPPGRRTLDVDQG